MWINKIKKRKIQMILIGVVVIISSFMLASSIGIITSVSEPMDKLIEETKTPLLFMTVDKYKGVEKDILDSKKTFEKDRRIFKVNIIENGVKAGGKIKYKDKYVSSPISYFLSYGEGEFGNLKFINGGGYLEKGECYINSAISETYKISLDDYIVVENPKENVKLKVKGIYSDPYNVSMAFGINRFYINSNQLKDIYGVDTEFINVFSTDYSIAKDVIERYTKNNVKQLSANTLSIDTAKLVAEISQQIIGGFIGVFALIVLLVSAIVMRVSIFDSIVKEYKTIGIYKSIGYSERTIVNIYIKTYSSVILLTAIVGSVFSKYLIEYTLKSSFKVYGVNVNVNYIMPIIFTVIFIIFIMFISIYGVIKKTKKVSPVEALTIGMPVNNKKGISLKSMNNNFSISAQAMRKIFNYKKFSIILFSILFICSYLIAFSLTMYASASTLSDKSNFWFGFDNAKYRLSINDPSKAQDIYKFVERYSEIKNMVSGNLNYRAQVSKEEIDDDGTILIQAYKQYDRGGISQYVIEGRNPKYDNEICISKKLAEITNKTIGDYIDIYINGKEKNLLITGFYQSMMKSGMNARLLESTIELVDGDYSSEIVSFNLKDSKDYENFKNNITNEFGKAVTVSESKEFYKDNLEGMMGSQKSAIMPFMILLIVIGAVNVFSIIMLMNINGKREFCIYKSLGYSTADLIETNCIYVLFLGIFAALISIPIFSFSYPIIMNTIFSMFGIYKYPADIYIKLLFIGLVLSLVIYILSTLLSSVPIRKFKVQELNED